MKILDRWDDLVHTHFVTDAVRLPPDRLREIERGFLPVVRARGIIVGIHFAHAKGDPGIRVVLECQPAKAELDRLQEALATVIAPIPTKPPTVIQVKIEGP